MGTEVPIVPFGASASRRLGALIVAHRATIVITLAGLTALVIGWRDMRDVLYDDAPITMRYAHRIASGNGWTYNDGDRTNGASAPLYTAALAVVALTRIDLESAVKVLAVLAFAAVFSLVVFVLLRASGPPAAALGFTLLLINPDFRVNALSGMESALACVLGLSVIAALVCSRETLAGVLLGFALLNKLDAAFLATAVGLAMIVANRRPPWRIAAISAAMLTPWLLFSVFYFGSPIPYSMTQKLTTIKELQNGPSQVWMFDALFDQYTPWLMGLAALSLLATLRLVPRTHAFTVAMISTALWPLLHAVGFQIAGLDPFPWYKTVLFPAAATAIALPIGSLATWITLRTRRPLVTGTALASLAVATIAVAYGSEIRVLGHALVYGHHLNEYESFEVTRRDAGIYVNRSAAPGDVVATCYGWIAFENLEHSIDETCPLNTRDEVPEPKWWVEVSFPGYEVPPPPDDSWSLVASFRSDVSRGGATFVYERVTER